MTVPDKMNRRAFLTVAVGGVATALPAMASSFVDEIVRHLRALGFFDIQITTTWLGRTQIVAVRGDGKREIILNPRTGEVLRDMWAGADGRSGPSSLVDFDNNSGSGGDGEATDGSGTDDPDTDGPGSGDSDESDGNSGSGGSSGGDSGDEREDPENEDVDAGD